jgi:hypothetical protein
MAAQNRSSILSNISRGHEACSSPACGGALLLLQLRSDGRPRRPFGLPDMATNWGKVEWPPRESCAASTAKATAAINFRLDENARKMQK